MYSESDGESDFVRRCCCGLDDTEAVEVVDVVRLCCVCLCEDVDEAVEGGHRYWKSEL